MAPGDEHFPSFKALGCAEHFETIGVHMPPGDRKDLVMLLTVFGFIPKPLVYLFLRQLEWSAYVPGLFGGAFFRFLRLGLRGIVWSLYYSGWKGSGVSVTSPLEVLGYQVHMDPR